MRVEVKSTDVRDTGDQVSKKTGRPYRIREQTVWVDLGKAYPMEVTLNLRKDAAPFSVGVYEAGPECWWVDRSRKLQFDLANMRPLARPSASKAA